MLENTLYLETVVFKWPCRKQIFCLLSDTLFFRASLLANVLGGADIQGAIFLAHCNALKVLPILDEILQFL